MARRYLARCAPEAVAQSFPPLRLRALRAAFTAISTSSDVAAGISPATVIVSQKSSRTHTDLACDPRF